MKLVHRFRSLFSKEKLDTEMVDEMRHHVELQTNLNLKAGMNPDEARYATRLKIFAPKIRPYQLRNPTHANHIFLQS